MKRYLARILMALAALLCGACVAYPDVDTATEEKVRLLQRRIGDASEAEVLALLGPPMRKVDFDNISQTAWDYVYSYGGYVIDLAIMIDRQGRVAQVIPVRREARDFGLR